MKTLLRFQWAAALSALLVVPLAAWGWGPDIHRVVGHLALSQLEPGASARLQRLTGETEPENLVNACNWPDEYRATPEGASTAPQHFINVPRDAARYDPGRDCPSGNCVAGAITRYAEILADQDADLKARWRAWARLCHFVGDIHQPLHVGFGHDRGGNDFVLEFRGQTMSLHKFWDHALFNANYPDWRLLATDLEAGMAAPLAAEWTPHAVKSWADESHRLARHFAYPPDPQVSREFAAEAWLISLDQVKLAGQRLAQLINSKQD